MGFKLEGVLGRLIATLLAVAMTCAACTGAPDRAEEAHQVKDVVSAMSGVSEVRMRYDNDVLQGTIFELQVWMEQSTEQQIEAVASKINEVRGNDFDEYDQSIKIWVADSTSVSPADRFDAAQVARTATLARQLRTRVQAVAIEWFGTVDTGTSRAQIVDAEATGAAVDAVLAVLGADRADIDVSAADRSSEPYWSVTGPLTVADKQRIDRTLAALPSTASWVGVQGGWLTRLTFGIPNPATAYQDVVSAIKAVDAGPTHPVSLLWSWTADPAAYNEPRFAGTVEIGKCVDYQAQPNTAGALTPEASMLQQRIRDEFSSCA